MSTPGVSLQCSSGGGRLRVPLTDLFQQRINAAGANN